MKAKPTLSPHEVILCEVKNWVVVLCLTAAWGCSSVDAPLKPENPKMVTSPRSHGPGPPTTSSSSSSKPISPPASFGTATEMSPDEAATQPSETQPSHPMATTQPSHPMATTQPAQPFLTPPNQVPPERRVTAYIRGQKRVMDIDEARSFGLTIVDLSDDWVPYIFWSKTPGKQDYKSNRYLDTYVDLANDRIDVDNIALKPWQRNYLEVYGIPPSLSVLRRRFVEDQRKRCFKEINGKLLLEEYHGPILAGDPKASERLKNRYYGYRAEYKKALKKARVRTLEALLKRRAYRRIAERYRKYHWQYKAIRVMQKRLVCEKMYGRRVPRIKPGIVNWAVRQALERFERKHNIYGWGLIFQDTARALGRSALENNYRALKRVLAERVISAARLVEDGTVGRVTYKTKTGQRKRVRNLAREVQEAIIQQMGLTSAPKALAFMHAHSEKDFKRMFVAIQLPKMPDYHSDQMDLSVEIDRGDVWYDFPFDSKGKRINQPRTRFPFLTLFVKYNQQKIPLVHWRTTIGGWQPEIRHNEEYYKYKNSDVGPRIWRHIVAGPVWVPPNNTPSRDMVKIRPVRRHNERIVAHNAFGPGYASAYGLVAAYHVTQDGRDNQVRTHGTVNYMSIKSSKGFSHGCHRLFNYRAVRLFSFILAHRAFSRIGQVPLVVARKFEHLGEEFKMDIRTRGYKYELIPPIPVLVREGRIRGKAKKPEENYIKKPTVVYQDDVMIKKDKQESGAPRMKQKRPKTLMDQHQPI